MKKRFKVLAGMLAMFMLLCVSVTAFAQAVEDDAASNSSVAETTEEDGRDEDEDIPSQEVPADEEEPEEEGTGEDENEPEEGAEEGTHDPESREAQQEEPVAEPSGPEPAGPETAETEIVPTPETFVPEQPVAEEPRIIAPMMILDNTPPMLKSISGTTSITLPATFELTLDIVEDGLGVTKIELYILDPESDNTTIYFGFNATWQATDKPLYTGKHTLTFETHVVRDWGYGYRPDDYNVAAVTLTDFAGNYAEFYAQRDPSTNLFTDVSTLRHTAADGTVSTATNNARITVKGGEHGTTKLNHFALLQDKAVAGGTVSVELDFTTEAKGVRGLEISLLAKNLEDDFGNPQSVTLRWQDAYDVYETYGSELLESGKHTLELDLNYRAANYLDEYEVVGIRFFTFSNYANAYYGVDYYIPGVDKSTFNGVSSHDGTSLGSIKIDNRFLTVTADSDTIGDKEVPLINSAKLVNTVVSSPGVLQLALDITEEGSGVSSIRVSLSSVMSDGHAKAQSVTAELDTPLKTGKHTVQVPIDTMYVAGLEYKIYNITITDKAGNTANYLHQDAEGVYRYTNYNNVYEDEASHEFAGLLKFSIEAAAANDIFVGLNNPALVDAVKAMPNGATAYINFDAGGDTVAPAALFEAVAGTTKTLAFQSEVVQWVFAGSNIKSDKVKDVDLFVEVYNDVMEKQFGDEEVVITQFANEGDLPGAAEVRFANTTLLERYGNGSSFYLTHFDDDNTQRETVEVKLGGDGVFGYTITHNSYFVLSSAKPLTEGVARESETGTGAGNNITGNNNSGSGSSGSKKNAIAETGDSSQPFVYTALAVLAVSLAGAAVYKKRRIV